MHMRLPKINQRFAPGRASRCCDSQRIVAPEQRGFSIVELIVVIAVVSMLIGILAPALSSVRASARSGRCQGNLKQMAIAAQNYAAIYDAWPAAIRYENPHGVFQ